MKMMRIIMKPHSISFYGYDRVRTLATWAVWDNEKPEMLFSGYVSFFLRDML